jgi:RNA polymerase sigma-70 factor, ECF subfamily
VSDEFQRRIIELLPRLRRFAFSLTGDLDRADDLVQDTCLRALSSANQWQPGTRLDSWMYRIAQNSWFDQMRARKVRGEVVDLDNAAELVGSDGRDVTEHRQSLAAVSAKLSELPRDQQLLVGLVCIDGLSYKEAAATLNLPIGTVMSRLARARTALATALQADETHAPLLNAGSWLMPTVSCQRPRCNGSGLILRTAPRGLVG